MSTKKDRAGALVFIISGPAGSGKTTICDGLLRLYGKQLRRAVTATTRPPRNGEKDGRDYFFLSRENFEKGIEKGDFIEYAQVHGNYYGTLRSEVERILKQGNDVLLNIDVQGAAAYRKAGRKNGPMKGRVVTIFIQPPSIAELRRRLLGRGTSDKADLNRRMKTAKTEVLHAKEFDYCFTSSDREKDLEAVCSIYFAEKCRVHPK